MNMEQWDDDEIMMTGEFWSTWRKPDPVLLCLPKILKELAWDWTRGSQRC